MPLPEEKTALAIKNLNDFLQEAFNLPKDKTWPDINLSSVEVNDIRAKLNDSLKEYIIEFVYVDDQKRLVKKSSNDEKINIIQESSPLSTNFTKEQPLIIIREKSTSNKAHLCRTKIENNNPTLEYLGEKEIPLLLTQSNSDVVADDLTEQYEEELENNVNVIKASKPLMVLSFASNGTCYLSIDNKNKTIVPTDIDDAKEFKKFVAKKCPRDGSLNIDVDENGKIRCLYTIDKVTHKKEYIEIDPKLTDKVERVIAAASSLQTSSPSPSPKPASVNNSFSAEEANNPKNIPPTSPPPANPEINASASKMSS